MGREIKFRAWDAAKGEHWSPKPQGMIYFDIFNVPEFLGHTHNSNGHWERRFNLMQYTGLHDKNGREIYEGDIVEDDEHYYGKVYWSDDDFMFCVSDYGALCDYNGTHLNVIGNVYENPELLENNEESQ